MASNQPVPVAQLQIKCPACDQAMLVPSNLVGTKVKCPQCGNVVVAQAAQQADGVPAALRTPTSPPAFNMVRSRRPPAKTPMLASPTVIAVASACLFAVLGISAILWFGGGNQGTAKNSGNQEREESRDTTTKDEGKKAQQATTSSGTPAVATGTKSVAFPITWTDVLNCTGTGEGVQQRTKGKHREVTCYVNGSFAMAASENEDGINVGFGNTAESEFAKVDFFLSRPFFTKQEHEELEEGLVEFGRLQKGGGNKEGGITVLVLDAGRFRLFFTDAAPLPVKMLVMIRRKDHPPFQEFDSKVWKPKK